MPQLDPASFSSQLFWLTLTFVALYLILARFVLPKIHSVLQHRQSRLDDDLSRAASSKEMAEQAKQAYEKSLYDARQNAHDMIVKTQADMARQTAKEQSELDADLGQKFASAEKMILESRSMALSNLVPVTSELAAIIVETLSHHKPDAKAVSQIVYELAKQKGLV